MYASLLHTQGIRVVTGQSLPEHNIDYSVCFHTSSALR